MSQINDRLEFPLELNMLRYTKEGRAATAATQDAAQRQAETEDGTGEDGDEDDVEEIDVDVDVDVAEVSVWFL